MRFYLTTAIDYVNSRPHLGTAYEKITADVIARYKRLTGAETHFLMGNDEHSQNVYTRARELGEDPLVYCDRMDAVFREVWAGLDISFDDFIRTSEPRHRTAVQKLAQRSADAGDVYEGMYEGWYCESCEAFKQERDLVDGLCSIHLRKPDWIREKNYFFRLSAYRDRLLQHFDANPRFLQPDFRRNEIVRLLESGLEDISISRAGQAWGIPLPFDSKSVVYVWFDALVNYAAAVGYGTDDERFAKWWPADLHVIGKDITRFHTVVWPAMLLSAGIEVPRHVFAHGWVHLRGSKMSKSTGTVIDPIEAAQRLGTDALRLYLTKEIAYGSDGDFSWERFDEKYNADLANNLGNLVGRLTTLAQKVDGRLAPAPTRSSQLAAEATAAVVRYRDAMERYALHEGVAEAFGVLNRVNEYLNNEKPWSLVKDASTAGTARQGAFVGVLSDAAEALRIATLLLAPVIPRSAAQILGRLGDSTDIATYRLDRDAAWQSNRQRTLTQGAALWPRVDAAAAPPPDAPAPQIVRSKETDVSSSEPTQPDVPADATSAPVPTPTPPAPATNAAAPTPPAAAPAASGPEPIAIDDFMKVDLRVARVVAAERVPKSKKLVKLTVDVGTEQRTLVAGIAEAYEAEALVGRTVVVVANLKPATLMGIESNGMVLAASPEGGGPVLVSFENPPPPGSRVR